jgi:hypothetical protein
MTDPGFGERVCTSMKRRRCTLEWLRGERVIRRAVRCEPLEHRVSLERRRSSLARGSFENLPAFLTGGPGMLATSGGVARRGLVQRP